MSEIDVHNFTARRIVLLLSAALVVALAVNTTVDSLQVVPGIFARGSKIKHVLLPAFYIAAFVAVWLPTKSGKILPTSLPLPSWAKLLYALVVVSTLFAVIAPRQPVDMSPWAQALALFAGNILCVRLGLAANHWRKIDESHLVNRLIALGLLCAVMGVSAIPFDAMIVPAFFASLTCAVLSNGKQRRWYAIAAAITLVAFVNGMLEGVGSLSVATEGQIAVGIAFLTLRACSKSLRTPIVLAAIIVAIPMALSSGLGSMLSGGSNYSDVTLAQRGYETSQVISEMRASPITYIFGTGPGGTVDLTKSPDRNTLLAAGRYLPAVDDVHLLTSYVMLKFGVLGILWLAVFVAALVRMGFLLLARQATGFEITLYLFAVCGFVDGIPASTNFLSDPLPALFLGVLMVRMSQRPTKDFFVSPAISSIETAKLFVKQSHLVKG